jgi:hypothetical protein
MADDDIFSNNEASVLGRLSNRLRVLIDLRHRLKTDKDHPIIDLKTRAAQRRVGHLIDEYKRLVRPSSRYFSKRGDGLDIHDYQEFDERLKNIAKSIQEENAHGGKAKGGRGRAIPGSNVVEIGARRSEQDKEAVGEQTFTSMDRIQKFLDQCEIDFQELPVELQLAAIEYLMNQNEAEFMTFINFIYGNLSQLRGELERRRKGASAPTQAEKNRQRQQMQQDRGMDGEEAGLEQQEGLREVSEKRDQPEEQPQKQMAFGKQLDKVNALMAKIEMAMGIQPRFNPTPNR